MICILRLPSCHFHTVTVCSWSRPTDSRSFPVALKLTEQTPPEWKQRSTDSVCLVMASHTWMDGDVAKEAEREAAALCLRAFLLVWVCVFNLLSGLHVKETQQKLVLGEQKRPPNKVATRWQ